MVVEWSDKYVDYKQLKKKVIEIKEKALELAQAYATIRGTINAWCCFKKTELADIEVDATIELKKIKERAVFWKLLEEQIETVWTNLSRFDSKRSTNSIKSKYLLC